MTPKIEWQVDSSSGPETIVQTMPAPSSRWRRIIVLITIGLGIGLGLAYRSIPEPPRSTPTPIVTPVEPPQPSVEDMIDGEAHTLAIGDLSDFMALQMPGDVSWHERQMGLFRTWGAPASGPAYTIVETGTLTDDRVWVDIIQFRNHQYFRETRFYQLKQNRWWRIAPPADDAFWGNDQRFQTAHFDVQYRAIDLPVAETVARQFEAIYAQVSDDLKVDDQPLPSEQKLQIRLELDTVTPHVDMQDDRVVYVLPSPRITGLYYPTAQADHPSLDRPFSQSAANNIVYFVARSATSGLSTWPPDVPSQQFLGIIAEWESLRLFGPATRTLVYQPDLLAGDNLFDLTELWIQPPNSTLHMLDLMYAEQTALVTFIDHRFGSDKVVAFLHVLGQAASLPEAIDQIGLRYPSFKLAWQMWLAQFGAPRARGPAS